MHLACATRGEVGTVDPEFMQGYDSVGEMRWGELTCAADVLGLTSVTHLGYRDSGMPGSPDNHHPQALAAAPVEEAAGKIVKLIRELRPQVVVTFDPIGGYRHPDHIAIHEATVRAFEAASDPARYPEAGPAYTPARLYYHTFPRGAIKWVVRLMPLFRQDPTHFGRNKDVDILSLAGVEFPITTIIRIGDYARVKAAAAACHRSQLSSLPVDSILLRWMLRLAGNKETFMRARPPFAGGPRESDLFAGI